MTLPMGTIATIHATEMRCRCLVSVRSSKRTPAPHHSTNPFATIRKPFAKRHHQRTLLPAATLLEHARCESSRLRALPPVRCHFLIPTIARPIAIDTGRPHFGRGRALYSARRHLQQLSTSSSAGVSGQTLPSDGEYVLPAAPARPPRRERDAAEDARHARAHARRSLSVSLSLPLFLWLFFFSSLMNK